MYKDLPRNPEFAAEQKMHDDFERLQNITKVLEEMGFQVIEHPTPDILENPTSEAGFPIVRDGLDGIRASYTKDRGLVIWFANSFEDRDNPRRKEVVERLNEEGLL
ncbi:MAG TPA: hypothetical protein VJC20_03885 [Candidatus Paceibacterota bacterium]